MPSLENLRKQAKQLVRWHRERNYCVAERIRAALPRYRERTDNDILAMTFSLSLAQEIIAKESGFESWAALKSGVDHMPSNKIVEASRPSLVVAYPQLYVADIPKACDFYTRVLGFSTVFVYGEPPFYGQVERDGVRLNLRYVCEPVFAQDIREREKLLSAILVVTGLKDMYGQFIAAGAQFVQTLKKQPWGAHDFVIRDPDGNLVCFVE